MRAIPRFVRWGLLLLLASGAAAALLAGGMVIFTVFYGDRVLPGTYLGDIAIGGMTRRALTQYLQTLNDKVGSDGVAVAYVSGGKRREFVLSPTAVGSDAARELYQVDIPREADAILTRGKRGSLFERMRSAFGALITDRSIRLSAMTVDRGALIEELKERLMRYEVPAQSARLVIRRREPLDAVIVPERTGIGYDYERAADQITEGWQQLRSPEIMMVERVEAPAVSLRQVSDLLPRLDGVLAAGPMTLTWDDPDTHEQIVWTIGDDHIMAWLIERPAAGGGVVFDLDPAALTRYFHEQIEPRVVVSATDARFRVNDTNRVVEFQGSRAGRSLEAMKTRLAIAALMAARTRGDTATTTPIVIDTVAPRVTTADVNTLGITEVLGVGISRYAGSPVNRVKNIANAVKKLNGILIVPDEEFSALKYLRPFTTSSGYLPELVIKADELKPEIGGGLCQLGTTLFRMAMNSAMPITERQNHSLVVQYYGDLRNGLPGTDATIYDPRPDFRFKNDTGHYLLLQTEMDRSKAELRFTLWGTSDGRKGSYTPPKLHRWIGAGETKLIETDTLAPGEKKCQHAFRGADASFTYQRELPDGTKDERVFTSHYRPLPEICLVGKAAEGETPAPETAPPTTADIPTAIE